VHEQDKQALFDSIIMPHMDAAYNLAYWLTLNAHDAEDVVQEALLRAFKFLEGFRGTNSRAWLLTIVRNACYSWLEKNRKGALSTEFDEQLHGPELLDLDVDASSLSKADEQMVREAIEELPLEFREALVLRELEGMSYKEISEISKIPIGTVMSRLARARKQLAARLGKRMGAKAA